MTRNKPKNINRQYLRTRITTMRIMRNQISMCSLTCKLVNFDVRNREVILIKAESSNMRNFGRC